MAFTKDQVTNLMDLLKIPEEKRNFEDFRDQIKILNACYLSKNDNTFEKILNNPGLQHLAENIFANLNFEYLKICQGINQSSKQILDHPKFWKIWQGDLKWKNPKSDSNQEPAMHSLQLHCRITSQVKQQNNEPEVRSENWPQSFVMQLIPKSIVSIIDAQSSYFSGAPSVVCHLQEGPSRDSLTKILSRGYAGCVHVSTTNKKCDIKVMILLYNQEKNTYLGCIPNDQLQFVDCIRKVIQQQKEQQRAATGNMMQQQQQQQQQQLQQQQQGNMMNPQGQMPNP